jgi:hypothetical protein
MLPSCGFFDWSRSFDLQPCGIVSPGHQPKAQYYGQITTQPTIASPAAQTVVLQAIRHPPAFRFLLCSCWLFTRGCPIAESFVEVALLPGFHHSGKQPPSISGFRTKQIYASLDALPPAVSAHHL